MLAFAVTKDQWEKYSRLKKSFHGGCGGLG
jgi:hypothetical protein